MKDSEQEEYVRGKAQWRAGIAALRKVRHLIDDAERDERFKRAAVRYVTAGLVAALAVLLVMALLYPDSIPNLFRSLS